MGLKLYKKSMIMIALLPFRIECFVNSFKFYIIFI